MELLTRNNFENWMRKLMERLDRQDELLLTLAAKSAKPNPAGKYKDVRQPRPLAYAAPVILKTPATLPQHRRVAVQDIAQKTYYSEEDVLKFLSEHVKDFRKEDIAFYKARIHNFFNK